MRSLARSPTAGRDLPLPGASRPRARPPESASVATTGGGGIGVCRGERGRRLSSRAALFLRSFCLLRGDGDAAALSSRKTGAMWRCLYSDIIYTMTRTCKQCGKQFEVNVVGNKDKNRQMCSVECQHARHRALWLRRTYGITQAEYDALRASQGNRCAICRTDKAGGSVKPSGTHKKSSYSDWHIDHCHGTGRVRGLLCHRCNSVLGYVKDDISVLKSMIDYLQAAAVLNSSG